jgi:hypothetical protein
MGVQGLSSPWLGSKPWIPQAYRRWKGCPVYGFSVHPVNRDAEAEAEAETEAEVWMPEDANRANASVATSWF